MEHLLNEVLERQERNSVKNRMAIERAIEKVGLELSAHRGMSEGSGLYSSERIEEGALDYRLFERDQQGWKVIALSPMPEGLFLAVFRQSSYYEPQPTDDAVESSK